MTPKKNGPVGSSLDDFLRDEGIYEEVTARAITRDRSPARCAHARAGHLQLKLLDLVLSMKCSPRQFSSEVFHCGVCDTGIDSPALRLWYRK